MGGVGGGRYYEWGKGEGGTEWGEGERLSVGRGRGGEGGEMVIVQLSIATSDMLLNSESDLPLSLGVAAAACRFLVLCCRSL